MSEPTSAAPSPETNCPPDSPTNAQATRTDFPADEIRGIREFLANRSQNSANSGQDRHHERPSGTSGIQSTILFTITVMLTYNLRWLH
jgi:hypothetical protein